MINRGFKEGVLEQGTWDFLGRIKNFSFYDVGGILTCGYGGLRKGCPSRVPGIYGAKTRTFPFNLAKRRNTQSSAHEFSGKKYSIT